VRRWDWSAQQFYRSLLRDLERERAGSAPQPIIRPARDYGPPPNKRLREILREIIREWLFGLVPADMGK
jgi:hypothetical protein